MKAKKVTGMKVIRLTKTEFELDNGDIYPLPFELDETLSLKDFNEIYTNSKVLVDTILFQSKLGKFSHNEKDTNN